MCKLNTLFTTRCWWQKIATFSSIKNSKLHITMLLIYNVIDQLFSKTNNYRTQCLKNIKLFKLKKNKSHSRPRKKWTDIFKNLKIFPNFLQKTMLKKYFKLV